MHVDTINVHTMDTARFGRRSTGHQLGEPILEDTPELRC